MFFSLGQGIPFARVLRNLIGAGGANMFYTLIASPIAIFSSYLYDKLYIGGIIAGYLPSVAGPVLIPFEASTRASQPGSSASSGQSH